MWFFFFFISSFFVLLICPLYPPPFITEPCGILKRRGRSFPTLLQHPPSPLPSFPSFLSFLSIMYNETAQRESLCFGLYHTPYFSFFPWTHHLCVCLYLSVSHIFVYQMMFWRLFWSVARLDYQESSEPDLLTRTYTHTHTLSQQPMV